MHSQDFEVITAAAEAAAEGRNGWLATVVAVHGSSPRPPGIHGAFSAA